MPDYTEVGCPFCGASGGGERCFDSERTQEETDRPHPERVDLYQRVVLARPVS